jgi:hypothetical protein
MCWCQSKGIEILFRDNCCISDMSRAGKVRHKAFSSKGSSR